MVQSLKIGICLNIRKGMDCSFWVLKFKFQQGEISSFAIKKEFDSAQSEKQKNNVLCLKINEKSLIFLL